MAVAPGARIEVHSGDDAEQASGSVTNGVFRSADAGAVTLTLANGQVRTLERDAVRRVRVRRPFFERPAGWRAYLIIIGVMTGFLVWAEAGDDDIGISSLPLAALTMFPAALPFFAATPMGTIYDVQPQPPRLVMAVDVDVTEEPSCRGTCGGRLRWTTRFGRGDPAISRSGSRPVCRCIRNGAPA